jgi:hypothetical protein
MVPGGEFWQTWGCMQNAPEAGAETSISAPSAPDTPSVEPDPLAGRAAAVPRPPEIGGPPGPEPTRYGDWDKKGRCIDF